MSSVCILDYGSGNVKSVFNLFSAIAKHVVISNDPAEIQQATHIILPGVGAFGAAMRKIHERIPVDILEQVVMNEKKPFMGICVGMQVLATRGMEFGECPGLGWIGGVVEKVNSKHLPLPHIGWNNISSKQDSPLLMGLGDDADFYFVHSYAFRLENEEYRLATTSYGEEFCSVIQRGNIYGVQFHPEKSQRTGIKLAKNFLAVS
jgi:glutamine amidotransferase